MTKKELIKTIDKIIEEQSDDWFDVDTIEYERFTEIPTTKPTSYFPSVYLRFINITFCPNLNFGFTCILPHLYLYYNTFLN